MVRLAWPSWVVCWMTPLPRRTSTAGGCWTWFATLARQSRSTPELLGSALGRRIIVHPLRHHEFTPWAPLAALRLLGDQDVALDEHLLIDASPPHLALGLSSALIVPGRLPANVRTALHHERTLDQLLEATAAFWTSETLHAEELTAEAASFPTNRPADTPMLRLSRRLSVIGTPVAVVVDEILQPHLPAAACGEGASLAHH